MQDKGLIFYLVICGSDDDDDFHIFEFYRKAVFKLCMLQNHNKS